MLQWGFDLHLLAVSVIALGFLPQMGAKSARASWLRETHDFLPKTGEKMASIHPCKSDSNQRFIALLNGPLADC